MRNYGTSVVHEHRLTNHDFAQQCDLKAAEYLETILAFSFQTKLDELLNLFHTFILGMFMCAFWHFFTVKNNIQRENRFYFRLKNLTWSWKSFICRCFPYIMFKSLLEGF